MAGKRKTKSTTSKTSKTDNSKDVKFTMKELEGKIVLVVLESPNKIAKLKGILTKLYPNVEFLIQSSYGHIIDLHRKDLSIDIENDFKPLYYPQDDKKRKVISDLKRIYKKCDDIIIATDKDREGEMIGWSVAQELDIKNPRRIIFSSITLPDIKKAMENQTTINMNIVNAQQARRVLDRLVGWKGSDCIRQCGGYGLSMGRVLSVATRVLTEREDEIEKFMEDVGSSFYKVSSKMKHKKSDLNCTLIKANVKKRDAVKLSKRNDAKKLMKSISKSKFSVTNVEVKKRTRNPSPPFTTSTLQQEGSRKLGWSIKTVMSVAQKLYEKGHITYMRTDSSLLSKQAISDITKFVNKEYGKNYLRVKQYGNKGKTQDAHEAVRPSYVNKKGVNGVTSQESRLYNLIWKRTIASQMQPAKVDAHVIDIDISKSDTYVFGSEIEKVTFPGFLKVYDIQGTPDDNDDKKGKSTGIIPKEGDKIIPISVLSKEEYKKPPARYSEASFVNKIDPKNLNIGRPATLVQTVDSLLYKKYAEIKDVEGKEMKTVDFSWNSGDKNVTETDGKVMLGQDKKKFVPTLTGRTVTKFLVENFAETMDFKFTSNMEDELDKIAEGNLNWVKSTDSFYKKFKPLLDRTNKSGKKLFGKDDRVLGTDDKDQKYMLTSGRNGLYLRQLDKTGKELGTAPVNAPFKIDTLTVDDAVEIFSYPKKLGSIDRKRVNFYKYGPYGPYVKVGSKKGGTYPIKFSDDLKEDDIDIEYVKKLIEGGGSGGGLWNAEEKELDRDGKKITVKYTLLDGRYGKYIKKEKKGLRKPITVSLPKDLAVEDVTLEKAKELIEKKFSRYKKATKNGTKKGGRKTTTKKTTKKITKKPTKKTKVARKNKK